MPLGVYQHLKSTPSANALNMPPVLVLGLEMIELGEDLTSSDLGRAETESTGSGAEQLDAALHGFIGERAQTRSQRWPIGLQSHDYCLSEADPQAEWRIIDYPSAAVDGSITFDPKGMLISTTEPGSAEFDALIDGDAITVTCPIWVDGLAAQVDWDSGAVTIATGLGTPDPCDRFAEAE